MTEVIIFGGTTEGRLLAQFCATHRIAAMVSVASDYGGELLPSSPFLTVRTGKLSSAEMEALLGRERPSLVADATHPYATSVTENLRTVCDRLGIPYVRALRDREKAPDCAGVHWVKDAKEAVRFLEKTSGNIFVTTGSKELRAFTGLTGYRDRVYARVLPTAAVLESCAAMGIPGSRLIAMQGPFSAEINTAILREIGAAYLVTKDSGAAGGFAAKLKAAREAEVAAVVIGRPGAEEGESLDEIRKRLLSFRERGARKIHLIGVGMGGPGQLTAEAAAYLENCDVVFGASRMLESVRAHTDGAAVFCEYGGEKILRLLGEHPEYREAGVVFSGDPGFYSGAFKMREAIRTADSGGDKAYEITVTAGLSSVSYFCARTGRSWEEAGLLSCHGRDCDVLGALEGGKSLFLLLGGDMDAGGLCELLSKNGYGDRLVSVGENLSYPDERITEGTAGELAGREFCPLSVMWVDGKDMWTDER